MLEYIRWFLKDKILLFTCTIIMHIDIQKQIYELQIWTFFSSRRDCAMTCSRLNNKIKHISVVSVTDLEDKRSSQEEISFVFLKSNPPIVFHLDPFQHVAICASAIFDCLFNVFLLFQIGNLEQCLFPYIKMFNDHFPLFKNHSVHSGHLSLWSVLHL